MKKVLVDTGFLVALADSDDRFHRRAEEFLFQFSGHFLIPAPVVVETCYFLTTASKVMFLDWLSAPNRNVLQVPTSAYSDISAILARYERLEPDFTDAAIVWLAGETGCRSILTLDVRDFSVYRLNRNRRFELVGWS